MTSATGSQAYIAMIKQDPATPRTIPTTPVMQKVNFVSDDLGTGITTKVSDHIRDDRMTADITTTGYEVAGGYGFEFQYQNTLLDELLAAFLWTDDSLGTPVAEDITGGSFTVVGAVLDLTAAAEKPLVVDGQKLKISGTANNGENDGVYTLTQTVADVYTVTPAPQADETFALTVFATGSMIRNGKFYQPFFIERGHSDVVQFFKFLGMSCNVLALEFADQADVTGSYQFIGLVSQVDNDIEAGATYTPVTTNPVFSTVTNLPQITIDGVVQDGCYVKEMTLEVNNNVTPKTGLGVLGACATNPHRLSVTGAITMHFEDSAMYQRLLTGTAFAISWVLQDVNGHGYAFTLPRVKLDTDTINVTGVDDDVMDEASYVAIADPVTNCMIQIDSF